MTEGAGARARRARALAERLIAMPSVSPDVENETECARVLEAALPARAERGAWPTPDGRPVVWAHTRGASPCTVVLLGHYDTVGVHDFSALGDARLACNPKALAPHLDRRARSLGTAAGHTLLADLDEERNHPGTWLFGRGALDMKSGLAAGIVAMEDLGWESAPPGGVLFVATPDEEHLSEGMKTASVELARLRERERLEYRGAINLDYALEPALYAGVAGKIQLGAHVLGEAAHVADPTRGLNALEIAARIVLALTADGAIAEPGSPRPAALGLDDLKAGYSIEPPTESLVEFTVPWPRGTLEEALARCRDALAGAFAESARRPSIHLVAELADRVGPAATGPPLVVTLNLDESATARAVTLERSRALCRAARLVAPAIVLHVLPPFYPPSAPRDDFARRVDAFAAAHGLPMRGAYPFISDASYLAWHCEPRSIVARHLLSLGREYDLPIEAAHALDVDVVNLGPWGHDAHRLFERVHAPFAFERLPVLIADLTRELWR